MNKIFICSILFAASALISCDKDIEPNETEGLEVKIANVGGLAKATNLATDDLKLSLDYSDSKYNQLLVNWTYDSNTSGAIKWTPEKTMLWKDATTCPKIYAYAPATQTMIDDNSFNFSAKADQSSEEDFEDSQLYGYSGYATTSHIADGIELSLNRQMSVLQFDFEDSTLKIAKVEVSNVLLTVEYTISDETSVPYLLTGQDDCVAHKISDSQYQLIVAPYNSATTQIEVVATTETGNTLTYSCSITTTKGQITPVTLKTKS